MTDEVKKEEPVVDDSALTGEAPEQPKVDQAIAEISRVASAACFGVGSRADAIDRMVAIGTNLIVMGLAETAEKNRVAVFSAILSNLAQAAGVQIQRQEEPKAEPEAKKPASKSIAKRTTAQKA